MTEPQQQRPLTRDPRDQGPPAPAAWLGLGLGLTAVGAVVWLIGVHHDASGGGPVLWAFGVVVLVFGFVLSMVGAVAFGVSVALTRRDWERGR